MDTGQQKIEPSRVPAKKLPGGDLIPMLGLGTFGSDKYSADQIAKAVKYAVKIGYRHIDCASVYQNEKEIGEAIQELLAEEVIKRKELWITGKVWNNQHNEVAKACDQTLKDLQSDYLDLYLVHWPFPNYHAPGCDGDARNPDSVPFRVSDFMETWRKMEALKKAGKVRNIGSSNMTIAKLEAVLPLMEIKPVVNEMEIHPAFQQESLYNYLISHKILPIGYSPIGSPSRPERDVTPEDAVDTEDPVIQNISRRLHIHPAVACIKWGVQRGNIVIPFSVKPEQIMANLKGVVENRISEQEMKDMKNAEKGSRLIKGQVFLWNGAQGWEDLWDLNGIITE
ncbi:MAG: aldo/keto reductase [Bacteroidales bacterium]|nr:aldo/keto reductase [Bacteroidales bacterium]